jgi:hypothetical protein
MKFIFKSRPARIIIKSQLAFKLNESGELEEDGGMEGKKSKSRSPM